MPRSSKSWESFLLKEAENFFALNISVPHISLALSSPNWTLTHKSNTINIPADVEELNRIKESLGTSVGCKKYFDRITQKFVPTVETERDWILRKMIFPSVYYNFLTHRNSSVLFKGPLWWDFPRTACFSDKWRRPYLIPLCWLQLDEEQLDRTNGTFFFFMPWLAWEEQTVKHTVTIVTCNWSNNQPIRKLDFVERSRSGRLVDWWCNLIGLYF